MRQRLGRRESSCKVEVIPAMRAADGVAVSAILPAGGFDAVLPGKRDQLLMEPMAVGAHTIQYKAGAVHADRMASLARRSSSSLRRVLNTLPFTTGG